MTGKWKIRINDGFCEYEYELLAKNPNVSIHDIYKMVRRKLKAEENEGKRINESTREIHTRELE